MTVRALEPAQPSVDGSPAAEHYDFLVLGAGSGGMAAARRAARHGARVALVEGGRLGGTCVNRGCVPKKIHWNAAQVADALRDAESYGFQPLTPEFDWPRFKTGRDAYVSRLNEIYERNLQVDGIDLFRGWAKLDGHKTLLIEGENGPKRLTGRYLLLAPGGRPRVPEIPGAELGITSDEFFELEEQPKQVAVVGAGYIAVELAGALNALGSDVTLVLRGERPLRKFDSMLADLLVEEMAGQGINVISRFTPSRVEKKEGDLTLYSRDGHCETGFDTVIWAVGRTPNTAGLELESHGIRLVDGYVETDEWEATSAADVFALGDVTGKKDLTPVAIAAGRKLADRVFGGQKDAKMDYADVPTVVFSHPPVATVGLSEDEAKEQFGDGVHCYMTRFNDMYHAMSHRKSPTMMKVVTVGVKEQLVGIHLIGRSVDEIIQGFAVALRMGATKADLDRTVAIHPTAAEELVTLK